MRFNPFKRFDKNEDVPSYLSKYLNKFIDEFNQGISKLTIDDNIDGQVISDIIIPASTELGIAHKLQSTPRFRTILRQSGNGLITDGATTWTPEKIYLRNNGAVSVTITVHVMR